MLKRKKHILLRLSTHCHGCGCHRLSVWFSRIRNISTTESTRIVCVRGKLVAQSFHFCNNLVFSSRHYWWCLANVITSLERGNRLINTTNSNRSQAKCSCPWDCEAQNTKKILHLSSSLPHTSTNSKSNYFHLNHFEWFYDIYRLRFSD